MMTQRELTEVEEHLTDGEPLISLTERDYIAVIRRLIAELRPLLPAEGWLSGPVTCLVCGHAWHAVRPSAAAQTPLECPQCHHLAGTAAYSEARPDDKPPPGDPTLGGGRV